MTRKLASIRKIDDIQPIAGADAIEVATVGGWKVVIKKGEYSIGDLAVYCEIDSWIPTELAAFLSKGKEPKEYNGVKGERLRTIKLRGQLSQGLLLHISVAKTGIIPIEEGDDVTEMLGIQKWEPVIPAQLAGTVKGTFPSLIPRTDQERAQNLVLEILKASKQGRFFEVTEKLEGSSMTCYMIDGVFGVCSRNLDLKKDENNTFWKVALELDIETKMRKVDQDINWAIQGELIGPGIQGNIYNLSKHEFHVYDVYNAELGKYLYPDVRRDLVKEMNLTHVPVLVSDMDLGDGNIETILSWADDRSRLNPNQYREGIVFKEIYTESYQGMTFKAISNKYLLGEKE